MIGALQHAEGRAHEERRGVHEAQRSSVGNRLDEHLAADVDAEKQAQGMGDGEASVGADARRVAHRRAARGLVQDDPVAVA
jgi:hypothetical protein